MSGIVTAALRTALQSWWGAVAAWLASHGVAVSDEQSTAIIGLLLTVCIGLMTAAIRWLETREGDSWQRWARRLAAVLMLGLSSQQPTYQAPSGQRRGVD